MDEKTTTAPKAATKEAKTPDVTAEEKAAEAADKAAEARVYTGEGQMTYEEYDKIGKGEDYEPSPETAARTAASDKAVEEAAEGEASAKG
jgi:hypothetical protein